MRLFQPAQKVVVRIKAFHRLALCSIDFRLLQPWYDGIDDVRGKLVLQVEDVAKRPVEPIRPQMHPIGSIDQLPGDTYPVTCFPDAAFEHIANTELTPDLLYIHSPALVSEARIAG